MVLTLSPFLSGIWGCRPLLHGDNCLCCFPASLLLVLHILFGGFFLGSLKVPLLRPSPFAPALPQHTLSNGEPVQGPPLRHSCSSWHHRSQDTHTQLSPCHTFCLCWESFLFCPPLGGACWEGGRHPSLRCASLTHTTVSHRVGGSLFVE